MPLVGPLCPLPPGREAPRCLVRTGPAPWGLARGRGRGGLGLPWAGGPPAEQAGDGFDRRGGHARPQVLLRLVVRIDLEPHCHAAMISPGQVLDHEVADSGGDGEGAHDLEGMDAQVG